MREVDLSQLELFVSTGPNPRIPRMFAREKGIRLRETDVDIGAGENRQPPYLALNPSGDTPALRTSSGDVIAEATVICDYLEELTGPSPLIGETPDARARTRMWARRIDLKFVQPFTAGFRYGPALSFFSSRVHCIPAASEELFAIAREGLAWIDTHASGQAFVTGPKLTLADIILFCFLDFNQNSVKRPLADGLTWVEPWFARMSALPSAAATQR